MSWLRDSGTATMQCCIATRARCHDVMVSWPNTVSQCLVPLCHDIMTILSLTVSWTHCDNFQSQCVMTTTWQGYIPFCHEHYVTTLSPIVSGTVWQSSVILCHAHCVTCHFAMNTVGHWLCHNLSLWHEQCDKQSTGPWSLSQLCRVHNSQMRHSVWPGPVCTIVNILLTGTVPSVSVVTTQVVVNALIQAIPSIFNVLLVCLVFWLIFSIMGVQLFGGRFHKCVDADSETINATIVPNKNVCLTLRAQGMNYTWANSKINFDNVGMAYLSLFQVVSLQQLFLSLVIFPLSMLICLQIYYHHPSSLEIPYMYICEGIFCVNTCDL